jgi:hypothetical protein
LHLVWGLPGGAHLLLAVKRLRIDVAARANAEARYINNKVWIYIDCTTKSPICEAGRATVGRHLSAWAGGQRWHGAGGTGALQYAGGNPEVWGDNGKECGYCCLIVRFSYIDSPGKTPRLFRISYNALSDLNQDQAVFFMDMDLLLCSQEHIWLD